MYFNWISTTTFVALNKRGVKKCFNFIIGNTKLTQDRLIKSFVLPAWSSQPFCK